ncbi:MAG: hypothetical protein PHO00_08540, partial [bacterium]|nr:hypothetical protein [bacterium]
MRYLLGFLLVIALCTFAPAADQTQRVNEKLDNCANVILEMKDMPENGIPEDLLKNCTGIAIFPNTIKGGFIFGGRGGTGVVLSHNKDTGAWSAPAF